MALMVTPVGAQDVSVNFAHGSGLAERVIQLIALFSVVSLAPSLLALMTSFAFVRAGAGHPARLIRTGAPRHGRGRGLAGAYWRLRLRRAVRAHPLKTDEWRANEDHPLERHGELVYGRRVPDILRREDW
jgi:hypothetical protein